MSEVILNEVRRGFYLDSVALMRLSRSVAALPGVAEAALMTGSPANREILAEANLLAAAGRAARANDLIVAVRARDREAAQRALEAALAGLETPRQREAAQGAAWQPRSLRAALRVLPGATLALVSVPGEFAAAEARRALRRGLHVMIFSDNVPLAEERALKEEARELGLLVMGPDCGTAILHGVPLAFANRVPRGGIGVIGASGTGVQEVTSLVAQAGGGISHALGVGGRDLGEAVGGITTLMALDALDADAATTRLVLISKPPDAEVARRVVARIGESPKPCTVCFLGAPPLELPPNARQAHTLREAAESALGGAPAGAGFAPAAAAAGARAGRITGLFSGGTLAAEAQLVLAAAGRRVASNAPVPGAAPLAGAEADADRVLDLGADEYTRGRPHPMIDPSVRDDALREALAAPGVAAVLLDVVIGHGAHPDPAGHLAGVLAGRGAGAPAVVASVTGTEQDPQVRSRQVAALERAGVHLAPSNAQAAELALALCRAG